MSIKKVCLLALILVLSTTSCAKDWFTSYNGNMPSNERISQLKLGDTKEQVVRTLGAPSSVVSFDKNTWIYMSSSIKRVAFMEPKEVNRDILTIEFNNEGRISNIERLTKADGKEIAVSTDATKSQGHDVGFFEKYFGGVGGYSPFPVVDPREL